MEARDPLQFAGWIANNSHLEGSGATCSCIYEGSLEVKLPTIWTDWKAMKSRGGKSQRRKRKKKEDQRRERESVRTKKIPKREEVEKSRNTVFFPMFCGSGGSKSRLAKAAGAEPFGQMREINNCTPLWREDARSTFGSQNAKNTLRSEHLWKLKC